MLFPNLFQMRTLPTINEKPPTLYALLNSIVNFGVEEKTKIYDLAKEGRNKIFDFNYPLSETVTKEDFEVMILNKFLMRRIGFETLTAFKIQLSVKLNEIMPVYNKMFDVLDGWNIFQDGELTERELTDTGTSNVTNSIETSNTTDSRNSELPQNEISNIQDGNYITNYTLNQDDGETSGETNSEDERNVIETISKSPADKMSIYKNFIESKNHIYSMIFSELECLFYGIE